ncbi:putative membrane protein [Propionispora sp. 2/2-37]|uniref:nitric-oxide reductase large subunit n=1 Tax=Propionispora sp. 2/2-37 TaxID=1677858 RepID=UPI0006BEE435|nr:nitric-oxide reductase large subunit [Propionispora sp. 2/2-37]CUH95646.1 putative membrane protein [Propionispora sp. 2/2-37]
MKTTRLWVGLITVMIIAFAVLGYYGNEIYQTVPPIPEQVITEDRTVVFTKQDIQDGQNIWQSMGGQEVGSVWGHGSYVAPDWSADWLHRELVWILDKWSTTEYKKKYSDLDIETQAALKARLQNMIRTNTYNVYTGDITISPIRAEAIAAVSSYYIALFGDDPNMSRLRDSYALKTNTIEDLDRARKLTAFFFWASWATSTNRPGSDITYTTNWPPEDLVGNRPPSSLLIWSVLSFVLLLAGIGTLAWYYAAHKREKESEEYPDTDPLLALNPTPSMKATVKYFWIVAVLLIVQIGLGILTAHYTVEGSGVYGFPLSKWLPYSVTRTWHLQLGIFWIATAWLATGLFISPAVSRHEPKYQSFGVNFLFICLLIIVVGSLAGEWLGVMQKLDLTINFWFGHQGYEYVDLGRFWQLFLTIGLFLWLFLMVRAIWPALSQARENKSLLLLFLLATTAIPSFYIPGLIWGQHTNMGIAEYWRWWVVHLWVEGFFEVFATAVIAFLFTRMGLLRVTTANTSVLFSTIIFLFGGIIGTFHHLYFSGTPLAVMALGATFSALEVVPLVLVSFEAYENLTLSKAKPWVSAYKWPIYFFVSVAFWNLVGAGLFGFFINPPIALYYMQGLNTTSVHGHTALFGVYGMLGIGLMLFSLKGLTGQHVWKTTPLKFSFWAINIGLALMVLISVLPVGIMQTWASVEYGMWYARSADFLRSDIIKNFQWFRIVGDTIFAIGAIVLGWFVIGLKLGWSLTKEHDKIVENR